MVVKVNLAKQDISDPTAVAFVPGGRAYTEIPEEQGWEERTGRKGS